MIPSIVMLMLLLTGCQSRPAEPPASASAVKDPVADAIIEKIASVDKARAAVETANTAIAERQKITDDQ